MTGLVHLECNKRSFLTSDSQRGKFPAAIPHSLFPNTDTDGPGTLTEEHLKTKKKKTRTNKRKEINEFHIITRMEQRRYALLTLLLSPRLIKTL